MTAEYVFTNETGIISVDTSTLLDDVKKEYTDALGDGLDTDASTPQGTMIQGETLARTSVMKNNAELANVINPSYSYGTFLDAIASLTGVERGLKQPTLVRELAFEGNTGVVVDAGSRIRSANGDVFTVLSPVTLESNTIVRGLATSVAMGNIPLSAGELTIVDGKIGWGAVRADDLTTVVPGQLELSDSALKVARKRRLYQQGSASLQAIAARVMAIDGTRSVKAIENDSGAIGQVHGIDFQTPNGVWVCVDSTASDQVIAEALFRAKQGGQPFDFASKGGITQGRPVMGPNGVPVVDPVSKVTYYVKFMRPVMMDLYVQITVARGTSIANADDIKRALIYYSEGLIQGEEGFVVGASASAFELSGAVSNQYPGLYVKDVKVAAVAAGSAAPTAGFSTEVVALAWQRFQINVGFVQVTVVP
ncbi:baseplate J protein [Pantoea phage Kyle]|uniref:Baseplate J protein n=1 Tax=Pantoea phage Kyle TaxID=2589665 RepID=A0A514A8W9_9CAUD|nr:baseplate wedge subunit [Pantoea phage Kyle]QDH49674.1 baseplate J protein [Pantoea phage Kyle]